jgi:hypothetical protein
MRKWGVIIVASAWCLWCLLCVCRRSLRCLLGELWLACDFQWGLFGMLLTGTCVSVVVARV